MKIRTRSLVIGSIVAVGIVAIVSRAAYLQFGSRYTTIPGSYWLTFARRLDGDHWSEPIELHHSDGLLDHRPVLLPHFEVADISGTRFRYRDVWQRANMVLVCLAGADLGGITHSIADRDDRTVGRRHDGLAVRKIVLLEPRVSAVPLALRVNGDEVIGVALADEEPGVRRPKRDTAPRNEPSTFERQCVRKVLAKPSRCWCPAQQPKSDQHSSAELQETLEQHARIYGAQVR